MVDEIQSGLGRTGKLFAYMHDEIVPDVAILGKALSGGFYPVSAVLSSRAILGVFRPGDHGSTFGGNPLACAVARMALRVLTEEGMIENAAVMGDRLQAGLASIASPLVREVRGRGLMLAVELHPDAGGGRAYVKRLQGLGLLCKETHDHTIRIAPPLVITADEVDWAVDRFAEALTG
jgi:ornithine--oxo-acid transaminase